jgi:hypothetical protein
MTDHDILEQAVLQCKIGQRFLQVAALLARQSDWRDAATALTNQPATILMIQKSHGSH